MLRGAWVAHLVKCPTLDLGSGLDLSVPEIMPLVGLRVGNVDRARDSLSLSLPLPCSISLSQNKYFFFFFFKGICLDHIGGNCSTSEPGLAEVT